MMSPFRSSSESHHSHTEGESFSEAFLHASSVRDSLPEQYRTHFDELKNGILAFCHEFEIPVETLKSKEDFGKHLTSKRIPQERMQEAVSLFERLEYLVTNREPLKEKLPEYLEEEERLYNLTEQYNAQVALLEQAGILNERNAIVGIDGKEYPVPTLEQIVERLYERREELSVKRDQGFTKLLLVPFGMSLDALCKIFERFLLTYKRNHADFDLKMHKPLDVWDQYRAADRNKPPRIIYCPKFFNSDHQGQTKAQILEGHMTEADFFPGWTIHLFQPSDPMDLHSSGFIPLSRRKQGTVQGDKILRPDFVANQSSEEYLFTLQQAQEDKNSPYHHESGLTPEDWMMAFMTHLQETGQPLDDFKDGKSCAAILVGSYFLSGFFVPCAAWDLTRDQARLSWIDPEKHLEDHNVRSSVIV